MKKPLIKLNLPTHNINTEETYQETFPNNKRYINANKNIEKLDFLDLLAKESQKDSFINILVKESMKINQVNNLKKKINEINLKEDNIEGLYDWSTLFNNSRPLSHYTRVNYKEKKIEENNNNNNDYKSPQILVDLPNDKMQFFFGKNSLGNNLNINNESKKNNSINSNINKYSPNFRKNSISKTSKTTTNLINANTNTESNNDNNNIKKNKKRINKRKSIKLPTWHFPYKSRKNVNNNINISSLKKEKIEESKKNINKNITNNTFYYSDTFSNYYKEDLKSFTKKMPILKAKVITDSKKLKNEIKKQKTEAFLKEKILYDIIKKDNLIINKQDLIISAERRNPVPLMKSIYKQENPDAIEIKEHIRKYFNTMKPYGNDDGKVDYRINDRWRLNHELIKFRKMEYKLKKQKEKENSRNNNPNYYKKMYSNINKKLILNYYDINDPDLDIFNKLNLESIEADDNNNEIFNKKNNSFEYKNNFGNSYNFEIEEIFYKNKNKTIDNEKLLLRPKTGFKLAKELNILNQENKNEKKINRPHSSNIRRNYNKYNNLKINDDEDYYFFDIKDYNELYKDYLPSNRFPLKTNSKINNSSYYKINALIKEKFNKKKLNALNNINYFITEPDLSIKPKIIKEKEKYEKKYNSSYNTSKSKNNKSSINNNTTFSNKVNKGTKTRPKTATGIRPKQKCHIFDFNKVINTNIDFKMNKIDDNVFFEPMNCFNKLAGKYYSSSNNVHIKNKRNKRKEILDINNNKNTLKTNK